MFQGRLNWKYIMQYCVLCCRVMCIVYYFVWHWVVCIIRTNFVWNEWRREKWTCLCLTIFSGFILYIIGGKTIDYHCYMLLCIHTECKNVVASYNEEALVWNVNAFKFRAWIYNFLWSRLKRKFYLYSYF